MVGDGQGESGNGSAPVGGPEMLGEYGSVDWET